MTVVVWYKRDLRIDDHLPLATAASTGEPVIPLYIVEPNLWQQPDSSRRHWHFIHDCLVSLRQELARLGQPLIVRTGEAIPVFVALQEVTHFHTIFCHQETGNAWTYDRDRQVIAWCQAHHIDLQEFPSNGVVRRLRDRDTWTTRHRERMEQPLVDTPLSMIKVASFDPGPIPDKDNPIFGHYDIGVVQQGGRAPALKILESFVRVRAKTYRRHLSKPEPATHACSRLSPYITYGCLSIREIFQVCRRYQEILTAKSSMTNKEGQEPDRATLYIQQGITAFLSRLYWHCHFIQRLEDQPTMETQCIHPSFEGMRPRGNNSGMLEAWYHGDTGYPIVDACMRSLHQTGWLNFRMRAMVVSFACYNLWLDWRDISPLLAGLFTDYEPGIHYSQLQMQSGVTGINVIRMYNPLKQSYDHDADGSFIRRHVPELRHLSAADIHEPGVKLPLFRNQSLSDYRQPIVDFKASSQFARDQIQTIHHSEHFKDIAKQVYLKHGSRKKTLLRKQKQQSSPSPVDNLQIVML